MLARAGRWQWESRFTCALDCRGDLVVATAEPTIEGTTIIRLSVYRKQ
jgi:hypothetical protein